jgi:hypothetical protein
MAASSDTSVVRIELTAEQREWIWQTTGVAVQVMELPTGEVLEELEARTRSASRGETVARAVSTPSPDPACVGRPRHGGPHR